MEIAQIDLLQYSVDVNDFPLEAAESQLFKGRDGMSNSVAIKIYKDLTLDQIMLYQTLTNSFAARYNKHEHLELELDGARHNFLLYVVPINKVGIVNSKPCTISPFIDGRTLFGIEPHYISSRFYELKNDPLVKLGREFRKESGYSNISIIPWNVKPLLDQEPPLLAVTDIAGSIRDIRKS